MLPEASSTRIAFCPSAWTAIGASSSNTVAIMVNIFLNIATSRVSNLTPPNSIAN